MKIIKLNSNPNTYSCNVYLILGTWGRIEDINSLIDVGTDGFIIGELEKIYTGVGKRKIDKVILTHTHFDHIAGLPLIKEKYNPVVYCYTNTKHVDEKLYNGQILQLGDAEFEVILTPGHSSDSICLYCEKESILFAGDTQINIKMPGGSYTEDFVNSLERLSKLKVNAIYHGHDNVILENAEEIIRNSLKNVKNSVILKNAMTEF